MQGGYVFHPDQILFYASVSLFLLGHDKFMICFQLNIERIRREDCFCIFNDIFPITCGDRTLEIKHIPPPNSYIIFP